MAIFARWFASTFNRPGYELLDYDVYALCGDGCMMEGISGEGASRPYRTLETPQQVVH
jgi:transketolase